MTSSRSTEPTKELERSLGKVLLATPRRENVSGNIVAVTGEDVIEHQLTTWPTIPFCLARRCSYGSQYGDSNNQVP